MLSLTKINIDFLTLTLQLLFLKHAMLLQTRRSKNSMKGDSNLLSRHCLNYLKFFSFTNLRSGIVFDPAFLAQLTKEKLQEMVNSQKEVLECMRLAELFHLREWFQA